MATGRNIQLTKQVGEYLVAAELCRRGLIATTFTGNVPDYDIVAVSKEGGSALIQVKAINGGLWQFSNARRYLDIQQKGKRQIPGELKPVPYPNLIYVLVLLDCYGRDRFFVLTGPKFHELIADHYRKNLKRHGGIRPRKHDSYHAGLSASDVAEFEGKWETIEEELSK